ncbi:hypothetical protein J2129_001420 [Methanofollis sp. W23]|uniref:hypothetical protein n=1 Tax=Methanofollis sp. W23 TaxID=2817849 RepID=UPI001AE545C3|nr:hypothetical protein [Methanofollis sp. W23]MBP2145966.1 hypothetical protein [Methanofollis sp. W23]
MAIGTGRQRKDRDDGMQSSTIFIGGGSGGRHASRSRIAFRISGRKHFSSRRSSTLESFGICSERVSVFRISGMEDPGEEKSSYRPPRWMSHVYVGNGQRVFAEPGTEKELVIGVSSGGAPGL